MASDPAFCVECGARIPWGRFSCPDCGALRASVRGRADHPPVPVTVPPEPIVAADVLEPSLSDRELEPELDPRPAGAHANIALSAIAPSSVASTNVAPTATSSAVRPPVASAQTSSEPRPVAGGYVAAVPAIFPPATLAPATFPPAAAAPVGSAPAAVVPGGSPSPSASVAVPADPSRRPAATLAPLALIVANEPFETPSDTAGWLVRGGSLAVTLSFLLPWGPSSVGVVGTGAIGYGYLDRWALVNAWYLLPMLLALFVFGLSVVPNRLLLWIRSGVLPLVTGALCLGIVFVYVGGPFGGGPGVAILAVASLALAGGGLLVLSPGRHDDDPPTV